MRSLQVLGLSLLALVCASCAELPARRYGLDDLRFEGVHEVDPEALRACLATVDREKLTLGLSALRSPTCGEPPFDKARASKRLFAWGWTDWPTYDEALLKLDLERITRWYRARGYYGARVLDVRYDPPEVEERDESDACEKGCKVDVTIVVQEGTPVHVRKISLRGAERLPEKLQASLSKRIELEREQIFDESVYDRGKGELEKLLREEGYARAKVTGEVVIARAQNQADIQLTVEPGPVCRIGKVRVQSPEPVPTGPILASTLLKKGQVYRDSDLDDAQRAIYAYGAFAAVNVRGDLETDEADVVDVVIEVEPRKKSQVQLGLGMMSGQLATGAAAADQFSVPQWDIHLLGSYEHRNFMGGLRKFRIEDRPRLLFLGAFPSVPEVPRFGNLITASFVQPGIFEPRTSLFVEAREDYGPDPFQLFFRNDIGVAIGLERGFWKQRVKLRGALHQEFMIVSKQKRQPILTERYPDELPPDTPPEQLPPNCLPYGQERGPDDEREDCARTYDDVVPASYYLPFIEERVTVDLRDDAANPTLGAYFSLSLHEAVRIMEKTWNYIRLTPDVRGYVPIGLGMVLAARFAMGALFVLSADEEHLDQDQIALGPQTYRLRGGGAQSNRGFLPGALGDSKRGGTRSWEGSLELRIPITKDISLVGFGDMGDVYGPLNGKDRFRFERLNTTFGGGLRYRTIVGPIRLDVGARPKNLQSTKGGTGEEDTTLGSWKFRGAIHLTIGEAF
jgi:outer membrane translocation and assembly module TamA